MNDSHLLMHAPLETRPRRPLLIHSCRDLRTWQAYGAVLGVGGGILTAFFGTMLMAGASILGNESGGFPSHGIGTLLLFLAVPLLIFGGHCLDLLERSSKAPNPKSWSGQQDSYFTASSFRSKPHLSKRELEERLRLLLLVRARLQSGAHSRRHTQR